MANLISIDRALKASTDPTYRVAGHYYMWREAAPKEAGTGRTFDPYATALDARYYLDIKRKTISLQKIDLDTPEDGWVTITTTPIAQVTVTESGINIPGAKAAKTAKTESK